ncbi:MULTISPECIES: hypothetical protein [unclassified Psychrobacter]|uniref:hypothetical protein n=1 Tax=unclassified Psychrobacter TaxID=196806 RepID=UPI00191AC56B|nr:MULTISPECIES: hypothetical protein [unclassified Psychrobacter]|tara:strand:+ start:13265 stop:13516 length:252 start_codon:yes stop_codon:yes gene_type:complete
MSNQISVSADQLESINEQIVLLDIDTSHLAMALQAVQVECAVSGGVINAVMLALFSASKSLESITQELDCMLTTAKQEATDHE